MRIERPRYLQELMSKRGNGQVKVVTGVRRCGKSYLMGEIFKGQLLSEGVSESNIVEMAFDRYRNRRYRDPDIFLPWALERIEGRKPCYLLLDEVQLLGNFAEVLIDLMSEPGVDIYVTGSNAHLLSKDVITEFRGRGDEIRMAPLSFSEFMSAYEGDAASGYEEYATYGGMPATVSMKNGAEKARYLSSLFDEIYLADIVERNHLHDDDGLRAVLDVLSSNIGSLTNPKRISDTLRSKNSGKGPGSDTVRAYIGHFEDAFLIEEAKRYDIRGMDYIDSPFKYYFADIGLRNARMNFRQAEPSHAMENVIYTELRARGYGVDVGIVASYGKNASGKTTRTTREVDFVCNQGDRRYYVQSAYAIPDKRKLDQEQASLLKIADSFRKIIVVHDPIVPHYNEQGIYMIGVRDFLLDPNSLDV
jgi:predicted AAA+ superfamily ATPase